MLHRGFRTKISGPPAIIAPAGSGGLYGHFTKICCGRVVKMATSSSKTFGGSPVQDQNCWEISFISFLSDGWTKMFRTLIGQIESLGPRGGWQTFCVHSHQRPLRYFLFLFASTLTKTWPFLLVHVFYISARQLAMTESILPKVGQENQRKRKAVKGSFCFS